MRISELKTLMKEINEPNEYILTAHDLEHPLYWIFKKENIRLKDLRFNLSKIRGYDARYDIFINGLFISSRDYILEHQNNDIYIKFKRSNFPELDRFGNVYEIEITDTVRIKGDVEPIR
jgi:hypothetical protein